MNEHLRELALLVTLVATPGCATQSDPTRPGSGLKLPASYYGIESEDESYLRMAWAVGHQASLVDDEYTPGLTVIGDVDTGIPDVIHARASLHVNFDVVEDRIDTHRQADWYEFAADVEGPLFLAPGGSDPLSVLWSAGLDWEQNSTYTERSLLVHAGVGLRFHHDTTSVTMLIGGGYYKWEADDEVPRTQLGATLDQLTTDDAGLYLQPEVAHEFGSGVVWRNTAMIQMKRATKTREVRILTGFELPMRFVLGDLCPESWIGGHVLLLGEYRKFDLDRRILPFDQESRLVIAVGSTF